MHDFLIGNKRIAAVIYMLRSNGIIAVENTF